MNLKEGKEEYRGRLRETRGRNEEEECEGQSNAALAWPRRAVSIRRRIVFRLLSSAATTASLAKAPGRSPLSKRLSLLSPSSRRSCTLFPYC